MRTDRRIFDVVKIPYARARQSRSKISCISFELTRSNMLTLDETNEAGKLLERVIMGRIREHLENVGPNIHEQQHGFRPERLTIDAINRIMKIAEGAVAQDGVALAVSVDIANAFNAIPWKAIREGLMRLGLPGDISRIIDSYLAGRSIEYEGVNGKIHTTVDRGVPQESVLGSLLWNVGYDIVLKAALPKGVFVTCYADDTLLLAYGKEWSRTIRLMEARLETVVRKITSLGLEVATNKTEASWFHGLPQNRSPPKSWIAVRGDRIKVGTTIKYLGLALDGRLNFEAHFAQLAPRVEKMALSLGRILPNIGGPKESVRRLYASITQSMMLYEAPIWTRRRQMTRRNIKTLRSVWF